MPRPVSKRTIRRRVTAFAAQIARRLAREGVVPAGDARQKGRCGRIDYPAQQGGEDRTVGVWWNVPEVEAAGRTVRRGAPLLEVLVDDDLRHVAYVAHQFRATCSPARAARRVWPALRAQLREPAA